MLPKSSNSFSISLRLACGVETMTLTAGVTGLVEVASLEPQTHRLMLTTTRLRNRKSKPLNAETQRRRGAQGKAWSFLVSLLLLFSFFRRLTVSALFRFFISNSPFHAFPNSSIFTWNRFHFASKKNTQNVHVFSEQSYRNCGSYLSLPISSTSSLRRSAFT